MWIKKTVESIYLMMWSTPGFVQKVYSKNFSYIEKVLFLILIFFPTFYVYDYLSLDAVPLFVSIFSTLILIGIPIWGIHLNDLLESKEMWMERISLFYLHASLKALVISMFMGVVFIALSVFYRSVLQNVDGVFLIFDLIYPVVMAYVFYHSFKSLGELEQRVKD